ncbi:MAG: MarR family transcriptional regulator [Chloroflexi bacterium]|nr:MarR family transcriptional regulator [Chloroflexota bacterium]
MNPISSPQEAYEIWLLLQRTTNEIRKARELELRSEVNITLTQAAALLAIKTAVFPLSPSELSRIMNRKPHTVHELLQRMEKEGLVIKTKSPNHKGRTIVKITKKGEEIHNQAKSTKLIATIISSLTPNKRKLFKSYLETLRIKVITQQAIENTPPYKFD